MNKRLLYSAGFLFLLVLFLGAQFHRAAQPGTLWSDEVYTLALITRSFSDIVDLTAMDAHPPGYYFTLKTWLKLFRIAGFEPGLVSARTLGIVAWSLLLAAVWYSVPRLFGRTAAVVSAVALAASASACALSAEMRQYSIASPILLFDFILLLHLYHSSDAARMRSVMLWFLYGATLLLGLWTHALVTVTAFLLFVFFVILGLLRKQERRNFFRAGVIVHIIVALLYLPAIYFLMQNYQYMVSDDRTWMTPATPKNLLMVFMYWYPLGTFGNEFVRQKILINYLAFSSIIPLLFLPFALRRRKESSALAYAAISALILAFSHSAILCFIQALGIAPVFHAPRYPLLAIGIWIFGIALLTVWLSRTFFRRDDYAALFLVPWLIAAGAGHFAISQAPPRNAVIRTLAETNWQPNNEPIYVMPSEFIPFYTRALDGFELRRIEDLARVPPGEQDVVILSINNWVHTSRPRDHSIMTALCQNRFALGNEVTWHPSSGPEMWIFRLHGYDHNAAAAFFTQPPQRAARDLPADVISFAAPETQRMTDGWSRVLRDQMWNPYIESTRATSTLRFDAPLQPGNYIVRFSGYSPANKSTIYYAEIDGGTREIYIPDGEFNLEFPIRLAQHAELPVLSLTYHTHGSAPAPRIQIHAASIMNAINKLKTDN